ncbi:MAG: hypothetical protein AVDCRST_MAG49-4207 [uncultured Thermomicrobiales bacterium]|uniref:Uncharacterized protein n=1 Tax=uncultured Thermomicrobiales bacterium TaxID=1645740 RepID=A0A6J4VFM2_9BACT|nr:MAG: hypothetical protein AVDCRST_MAG49-4207 [uncultured Thermomicrobiales bacterium]
MAAGRWISRVRASGRSVPPAPRRPRRASIDDREARAPGRGGVAARWILRDRARRTGSRRRPTDERPLGPVAETRSACRALMLSTGDRHRNWSSRRSPGRRRRRDGAAGGS